MQKLLHCFAKPTSSSKAEQLKSEISGDWEEDLRVDLALLGDQAILRTTTFTEIEQPLLFGVS